MFPTLEPSTGPRRCVQCGGVFHGRCLGSGSPECPLCDGSEFETPEISIPGRMLVVQNCRPRPFSPQKHTNVDAKQKGSDATGVGLGQFIRFLTAFTAGRFCSLLYFLVIAFLIGFVSVLVAQADAPNDSSWALALRELVDPWRWRRFDAWMWPLLAVLFGAAVMRPSPDTMSMHLKRPGLFPSLFAATLVAVAIHASLILYQTGDPATNWATLWQPIWVPVVTAAGSAVALRFVHDPCYPTIDATGGTSQFILSAWKLARRTLANLALWALAVRAPKAFPIGVDNILFDTYSFRGWTLELTQADALSILAATVGMSLWPSPHYRPSARRVALAARAILGLGALAVLGLAFWQYSLESNQWIPAAIAFFLSLFFGTCRRAFG